MQEEASIERQVGIKFKRLCGDDASEYSPLAAHCASRGIIWDPITSCTKKSNAVKGVKNRHLVEPVVAILVEHQLPKHLWTPLIKGVNHTVNRLFHPKIGMTPCEAFHGQKPDVSHLRALGCQCWYFIPDEERDEELDLHMAEGRLVAYYRGGSYAVYDLQTKKVVRSQKVVFNETSVPTILPEPSYDLGPQGPESEGYQHQDIKTSRYVPIEFLNDALNPHPQSSTLGDPPYVGDLEL